jgi:outer membrane protein OmpA-like peptidoglycan-associated protein
VNSLENNDSKSNPNKPINENPNTTEQSQPVAVKIDLEMDYAKEQERNNQGFLATLGEKIGLGAKDEQIKLIDAGAKGQKINRNVYFKFDSDKLQGKFYSLLDIITEELEKNPQIKIMLEGHTDAK